MNPRIDEARFARLWAQGLTYRDIEKVMGIAHSTVCSTRRRLGLPLRGPTGPRESPLKLDNVSGFQPAEEVPDFVLEESPRVASLVERFRRI